MSQSPRRDGGRWDAHADLEPLQDAEENPRDEVLEDRLVDEDRHPDAAELDRLLGDVDLLVRLQLHNYAPAVWNPVAEEFARYGLATISSWIRRGLIFGYVTQATGFGFPSMDTERIRDPEAVHDLASMTVVNALNAFLESVLKTGRWDPKKGASLKTFFVGQCKFQFPNVYKSWWREQRRRPRSESLDDLVDRNVLAPAHNDVEAAVDRDAEVAEALTMIDSPEAQSALLYQAEGYSHAEIALIIGLRDAKAVENLIGRWRRRIAKQIADNPGRQQSA